MAHDPRSRKLQRDASSITRKGLAPRRRSSCNTLRSTRWGEYEEKLRASSLQPCTARTRVICSGARVAVESDDTPQGEARSSALGSSPTLPRFTTRGEYLVVGESPESTLGLLRILGRTRPARHARSLAELPARARSLPLTGLLFLHQPSPGADGLLPDPSLVAVWRTSPRGAIPRELRLIDDEPGLFAWLSHTVAFEHTGSSKLAHAVELAALEYGLTTSQAEVLAVCTCSDGIEERAARLALTRTAARRALKDLSDAARGVPLPRLVARVLERAKKQ